MRVKRLCANILIIDTGLDGIQAFNAAQTTRRSNLVSSLDSPGASITPSEVTLLSSESQYLPISGFQLECGIRVSWHGKLVLLYMGLLYHSTRASDEAFQDITKKGILLGDFRTFAGRSTIERFSRIGLAEIAPRCACINTRAPAPIPSQTSSASILQIRKKIREGAGIAYLVSGDEYRLFGAFSHVELTGLLMQTVRLKD
ncbi:hypothetical protein BDR05DRAFT_948943 [Suillus weaverae]|nr:hypothetical protein BDR05DRAFT_948943 [Suillus weaverae]